MELDDLLKNEGLDAAGIDDALAWARRRAAELVRDVDGDPELGPLLDGARVVSERQGSTPPVSPSRVAASTAAKADPPRPLFTDLRGLQAAFLAEGDEDEDADLPEVGAVLRAFQKARPARAGASDASGEVPTAPADATMTYAGGVGVAADEPRGDEPRPGSRPATAAELAESAPTATDATDEPPQTTPSGEAEPPVSAEPVSAEPGSAEPASAEPASGHGVPAPPEADLDPLAGIDFDDLPGVDEDDEEDDHTHVDLPSPGRLAAAGEADLEGRITMVPVDGPDSTLPSMQMAEVTLTAGRIDASLSVGDLTERTLNPLLVPAEPTGEVTVTAPNPLRGGSPEAAASGTAPAVVEPPAAQEPAEVEAEEIELLDDEDLLMVEEEEEPEAVPEWKQALASAQPHEPAPDDESGDEG